MFDLPVSKSAIAIILIIVLFDINCHAQEYYEEIIYPDTLGVNCMLPFGYDTILVGVVSDNPYAYGSVYKSFDSGITWEFSGLNNHHIYCLLRGNEDTIYAGTGNGVFTTNDFGNNWIQLLPMSKNVVCLAKFSSNIIYAGYWGGIMRSLDNGFTWDTSLVLNQNSVINALLIVSENEIYAGGTAYTSSDAGVFRSTDLGETWNYIGLVNHNIQALGLNADHELFAGCFYSGLMKTQNDGMTWETVLPYHDVVSMIIDNNGMYIGCENQSFPNGGIYYSADNGLTWEDRTYNITNKRIIDIHISPDQYLYSLSRYETTVLGPPFNRSVDPVLIEERVLMENSIVQLYPNPASDILQLIISNELLASQRMTILIFNSHGQFVSHDSIFLSKDQHVYEINVSILIKGIYYIQVDTGSKKYLQKLMIH